VSTIDHPAANIRVGDAERSAAVDRLTDHHAAGRLTLEELEERVAAAWQARAWADLARLEADLPPVVPARSGTPRTVSTANRVGMYAHVATYVGVIVMLWVIWLFTGMGHPWPIYPMFGWGIGILGHLGGVSAWSTRGTGRCGPQFPRQNIRL
jgi:hypothetical protein